jgi:hypothetical protein
LRHAQFFGGAGEIAQSRRGFKSTRSRQRRQLPSHRSINPPYGRRWIFNWKGPDEAPKLSLSNGDRKDISMSLTTALIHPGQMSVLHKFRQLLQGWRKIQLRRRAVRRVGLLEFSPHLLRDMGMLDGHVTLYDGHGSRVEISTDRAEPFRRRLSAAIVKKASPERQNQHFDVIRAEKLQFPAWNGIVRANYFRYTAASATRTMRSTVDLLHLNANC